MQSPSEIEICPLGDDGVFPNHRLWPLLVYRSVLAPDGSEDPPSAFERTFAAHGWTESWRDGVYDFHHYHSTAHEVLGCYRGAARVRFGGPDGVDIDVCAGDVVVIPAGVAHRREWASDDFCVVGAYDQGRPYDMKRGEPSDRPKSDENIDRVPRPRMDPVFGEHGPLLEHWPEAARMQ